MSNFQFQRPSEEQLKTARQRAIDYAQTNPSSFVHWFPKVQALDIPHPVSETVEFAYEDQITLLEEEVEEFGYRANHVVRAIKSFGEKHGYPMFIKNCLFSGKHSWNNTCYIPNQETNVLHHVANIVHDWACVGAGISLHFVIRKFIECKPAFHAFRGTPITEEYRFFAADGTAYGWQPYWPEVAIRNPTCEDWREKLSDISKPSSDLLQKMIAHTNRITGELGGDWSVDFLIGADGTPYLIDMAEARKSFRCDTGFRNLPNNSKP